MTEFITNGSKESDIAFILAHGAGAGMDTEFMDAFANKLSQLGIYVVRFEFPYMITRRETGSRRPPDRAPKLLDSFNKVISQLPNHKLIIGGKSMGGRMASMIAAEDRRENLEGCVCLGYPFHPPGKPEKLRIDHFANNQTPTLICQGTRDTFGTKGEVENYDLGKNVELCWLEDGDHNLKPRKKSGLTHEQNIDQACLAIAQKFIK